MGLFRLILSNFRETEEPSMGTEDGKSDNDQLVARLGRRIHRFIGEIDPLLLFEPDVDQELTASLPIAAGPPVEPEVATVAGTLAWLRYLVFEGPDASADLILLGHAVAYFMLVYPIEPGRVPEPLHELLQSIRQKEEFVPFCEHWGDIRRDRKGLMLFLEVVNRLNDTASGRAISLAKLSDRLWHQAGNPISLATAVAAMETALREAPPDHPDRAQMEAMLGCQLQDRWASERSAADLDAAIEHLRTSVGLTADQPVTRALAQADLGDALQNRYREAFRPEDLTKALEAGRESAAGAPEAPLVLHKYANALLLQFQENRDLAVRGEAIRYIRKALRLTPQGGPGRAAMLAGLAAALRSGYRQTRSEQELDEAIDSARQALDELDPADKISQALSYGTLGVALLTRFQLHEQADDLINAAEFSRRAVELTPGTGAARAQWQSNYAGALRARWERKPDDFGAMIEAIDLMRQAADATPVGHPSRAMYVINIGAATQRLCLETPVPAESAAAALAAADADLTVVLDSFPADAPASRRAALLAARGALLTTKYEQTTVPGDLDVAVRCCRQSVELVPEGGGEHADYTASLASALLDRARLTGQLDDIAQALAAQLDTAVNPAARVRSRIAAFRVAAGLLVSEGDWAHAAPLLAEAVELMTLTAPRQLDRADQEYWLGQFGDLAADAAAAAIGAGRPRNAVRVLELGRGVLIGQSLQLRGAVEELQAAAPELAARFEQIRLELDAPAGPVGELRPDELADAVAVFDAHRAAAARRGALAAELGRLAEQIRKRPGMAGFLQRPAFDEIAAVAADGPVIFLNVSQFGSHALIVTPAEATPVGLDTVTPASVTEQVTRLQAAPQAVESARAEAAVTGLIAASRAVAQAQDSVRDVLDWLWQAVAEPVLAGAGLLSHRQVPLPRIWWAPVGALSLLPVHAAASRAAGTPGALDLVVSSYTATLATLAQARKHQRRPEAGDGMLVVAMPSTPGAADLPGAAREAALLTSLGQAGPVLGSWVGAAGPATRETVTAALPRYAMAHFACHARCDPADPAASVLFLQDDQGAPLTLGDILALSLDHAQLAYLSACETALTPARLANEALHLVTAFGLAGYPQVIGTLWQIEDGDGYAMTSQVYQHLAGSGQAGQLRPELAARAVHEAALQLRAEKPGDPLAWAAHIHSGG
jgi:CHAT domain-containing protein/tetratricopeptide (TPR) repeat protein